MPQITRLAALLLILLTGPRMVWSADITFVYHFAYPGPSGLSYDPRFCGLWVANETRVVRMISPWGDEVFRFDAPLSRVDAIAVSGEDLILSDGNGAYQRVDREGRPIGAVWRAAPFLLDTDGLFYDEATGETWIVDDTISEVVRVGRDGRIVQRIAGAALTPPLLEPQGITIDPRSGNILVADDADASDSLFEFSHDGRLLDVKPLGSGGYDAEGITIQPDTGTVFVAYDDGNMIAAFHYIPTAGAAASIEQASLGGCVISALPAPHRQG